jgi:hypothetical protein
VRAAASRDATRLGGGNSPLHYAAYNARALACLDLLLRLRVPLDARNDAGCTALFFAAQNGNAEAVSTLMRRGADPTLCESETGCSFSPAEVGADDPRVLAALECGALRSRGVLYARPSRLRAPVLLAPSELVFDDGAGGGGLGSGGGGATAGALSPAEAVGVRLRPRQPLRVQFDVAWAASVSRISGREAARSLGEATARLASGGFRPPAPASLDDSIARPPSGKETLGYDDSDEESVGADEDGRVAAAAGGGACGGGDDLRSASDAMLDADGEYALQLPSVALVPLPWASIEVGVIDVTAPAEPTVARRVLLGRRECEAAGHVCIVEGLAPGRTFMVKARAVNALGRGSWSAPTLPITVARGGAGGSASASVADARAVAVHGARTASAAAVDDDATAAAPFSSERSSARLGDAWAEEAAAAGERATMRSSTPRPTSVRLEELGAAQMSGADFAAMTSRRALLSVRSGGSGRGAPKTLTREQQAAAEAAEAAAVAAAIAAAQAAARAAALPRAIGRGVMAAPARVPGAKAAAPPKPPRAKLVPVIYKVAPDRREDEEEEEEAEEGNEVVEGDDEAAAAVTAAAATSAPAGGGAKAPPAAAPRRAAPRATASTAPRRKAKKAAPKATTLGGVRQPRRYFAPAYYEDPYARQMGESMLRDEAAERERLIELARAEGDAEALAAAEAEAAAAAAAALAADEEDEEPEGASAALAYSGGGDSGSDGHLAPLDDEAVCGAADRTVRFVEDAAISAAAASPSAADAPRRTSKLHDSSLRSFLMSAAEESRSQREGLGPHLDIGALAERLPGVLREAAYDPAYSPAASRAFAEDAALGLSLRSTGPSSGLGARAERLGLSKRLAGDDAEAIAARKRETLEAQLGPAAAAAKPPLGVKAATRGGAHSLFVTPSQSPYASYAASNAPPRVADLLIAQQRKSHAASHAFSAAAGKRPGSALLGAGLSAHDLLAGRR